MLIRCAYSRTGQFASIPSSLHASAPAVYYLSAYGLAPRVHHQGLSHYLRIINPEFISRLQYDCETYTWHCTIDECTISMPLIHLELLNFFAPGLPSVAVLVNCPTVHYHVPHSLFHSSQLHDLAPNIASRNFRLMSMDGCFLPLMLRLGDHVLSHAIHYASLRTPVAPIAVGLLWL